MELRIFTEPQQGASYEQLLAVAQRAEARGFGAFFRSDHYLHFGEGDPLPGPTDAWVTLAGLARDTATIRLGTLVSPATFRLPGPLAISVAQVDAMSGGRVELGIGAGWFEREHEAYGITYPGTAERFSRLSEQLEIITGLWRCRIGESYSFAGEHYRLEESPALPKPVQEPYPPVIIGGHGKRRTPRLAARFADEFNVAFGPVEECESLFGALDEACEEASRDARSVIRSVAVTVCCGSDERELKARAAAIGRDVDQLRAQGVAGSPGEVVERLAAYGAIGATRAYLQVLDLSDLDHLDLIAEEVMGEI